MENLTYNQLTIHAKINLKSNIKNPLFIAYKNIKNGAVRLKYIAKPNLNK
ncbi:hypothetical protein lotta81_gp015 [Flavobacterium phage vB_FspM_lotta8-1]|uniref:Uncharacterized protein n=1 Tax=Flavobacterium phage vB_FspM_lotta8-1 TaxID=2686242 RepID=A0A6B9LAU1_9CAUD|nr:hypothetical protein HWC85_gp15 [Flavobacterium phage vB_FspM_lotta8-1]QHB38473.1 hypothetical protein lotta81_gp015 [Flavobacterium phage vB_FspM_lotta8-1]